MGGTPTLVIGNRNFEGARGFDGWIQDFRLDTGVSTNPAAYVEGIRQSSPGIILDVNFIDDSVNVAYGGGADPAPSAMSGAAVIGSSGDIWNGLHGFAYSAYPSGATYTASGGSLLYTDGTRSAVTLSLSAPNGSYDNNAVNWSSFTPFSWASYAAETAGTGYPNTPYAALMATIISTAANTANGYVNLGGLSPNAVYNLYVYSAGNAAGRASTFTVGGGGGSQVSTYDDANTNLVSEVDYLEFAGVTADASGNLAIGFGNGGVSECDFNGFQLQFVSGTPPLLASAPPTITCTSNLAGYTLCTNTSITFTAVSVANTITNFQVVTITSPLGSAITTTTTTNYGANGTFSGIIVANLGTGTATVQIPLPANLKYSVTVTAMDSTGRTAVTAVAFDTFAPTLVIEASDYNFNSGQFIDTPANGGVYLYTNVGGASGVDFYKSGGEGPAPSTYRQDSVYLTATVPDTVIEQKYNGITNAWLSAGYTTPGDWLNFTRTFGSSPADSATSGTYDVWLFMATDNHGPMAQFSLVSGATSQTQTSNVLGSFGTASFGELDWDGFEYVPMTDQYGNLQSVTLNGQETLQIAQIPSNPNLGFLMLMPATSVLTPGLSYYYPDGARPFEGTNLLAFTVTPHNGSNILASGIDLVLNNVDVSSGLKITAAPGGSWKVSYPIQYNTVYAAVISMTNTAGLYTIVPINFDTFNVNSYQWEAVDYDFSTNSPSTGLWISGLFIDNPVPTCDTTAPLTGTMATNSYFEYPTGWSIFNDPQADGAVAQQGIDINFTANGQNSLFEWYRNDGVGSQVSSDFLRPKFVTSQTIGWPAPQTPPLLPDPNVGIFNICYTAVGNWLNYTRTYPAGNYYVWGRLASANPCSISLGQVSGAGTTNQTVSTNGTFTVNNPGGNQAWQWIPLLDANGNQVVVSLSGAATTLRTTVLTQVTGANEQFYMLVPGPLTLTATLVSGQLSISFPTDADETYQLQHKSTLAAAWANVGSVITGTGSTYTVPPIAVSGAQGYYQVVATIVAQP